MIAHCSLCSQCSGVSEVWVRARSFEQHASELVMCEPPTLQVVAEQQASELMMCGLLLKLGGQLLAAKKAYVLALQVLTFTLSHSCPCPPVSCFPAVCPVSRYPFP